MNDSDAVMVGKSAPIRRVVVWTLTAVLLVGVGVVGGAAFDGASGPGPPAEPLGPEDITDPPLLVDSPAVRPAPEPDTTEADAFDDRAAEVVAEGFVRAWEAEDWEALQALTADQSLDAAGVHRQAHRTLDVEATSIDLGPVTRDGDRATAEAEVTWDLGDLGSETFTVEVVVRRRAAGADTSPPADVPADADDVGDDPRDAEFPDADDEPDAEELPERAAFAADLDWRVGWWYPTVHPDLTPDRRFQRVRVWPERAPILDIEGEPLVTSIQEVVLSIDIDRAGEPDELAAALDAHLDLDPEAVITALADHDTAEAGTPFVQLGAVPVDDWDGAQPALAGDAPSLRAQRRWTRDLGDAESLARLIGGVGDVTAELLESLGDEYRAGDRVGRSGIERTFERRLAGVPSEEAFIGDAAGLVRSLAYQEGSGGEPVQLTLNRRVQDAAMAATSGMETPVALVALDARDGTVLGSVSRPLDEADRALAGQYPPGSTFKVVTAEAMLEAGTALDSPVPCPGTITLGGQTIGNAGGDAPGTISFLNAFSRSCNTVFAGGAVDLGGPALLDAAERFGFNTEVDLGLVGGGGSFPLTESPAELGQASIGQARVLASPLQMASVAGTVRDGAWHPPRIVVDPEPDVPASIAMDADVRDALDAAMRDVVASGTGRSADVPGNNPVHGKTGSAQFGSATPLPTHAWFIGYRGNLAFAVIVEGGGAGGRVAGPIAARFLQALDGADVDAAPDLVPEQGPDADIDAAD